MKLLDLEGFLQKPWNSERHRLLRKHLRLIPVPILKREDIFASLQKPLHLLMLVFFMVAFPSVLGGLGQLMGQTVAAGVEEVGNVLVA